MVPAGTSQRSWPATLTSILIGLVFGVFTFAAIGVFQMLSVGVNAGALYGWDGQIVRAIAPAPNVWIGVTLLAFFVILVVFLRGFMNRFFLAGGAIAIISLIAYGSSLFWWGYLTDPGSLGWLENIALNGSQSLASWLLAAILVGFAMLSDNKSQPHST